jgi:hypothetical protein
MSALLLACDPQVDVFAEFFSFPGPTNQTWLSINLVWFFNFFGNENHFDRGDLPIFWVLEL